MQSAREVDLRAYKSNPEAHIRTNEHCGQTWVALGKVMVTGWVAVWLTYEWREHVPQAESALENLIVPDIKTNKQASEGKLESYYTAIRDNRVPLSQATFYTVSEA